MTFRSIGVGPGFVVSGTGGMVEGSRWPALDGLRGLAVAAVVAYHVDPDAVPGGFLGVSLFFSLSGFLIIGRLVEERRVSGRIDLPRFWRRRVARLLPAFVVTVVGTVVLVAARQPEHLDRVAADAVAGLANVANWHDIASGVDYGARFGGVDPLGHLWSLSIEEQFYLCVPLVVALVGARWGAGLGLAAVAAGMLWFWGSTDAYLASPVRFAEVLCGGFLGAVVHRRAAPPPWLTRLAWPAGVVGVVAVLTVGDAEPFLFELGLPIAGLVWTAVLAGAVVDGRMSRGLAWTPLRWLGDRSYAIYLFHLPVLELTDWSAPVAVAVTLGLADISRRVVELPVREQRVPFRLPVAAASALTAAVAVMAATVLVDRTTPSVAAAVEAEVGVAAVTITTTTVPIVEAAPSPSTTVAPPTSTTTMSTTTMSTNTMSTLPPPPPPLAEERHAIRVLALGDSTMNHLVEPLEAWVGLFGGDVVARAVPGCSPLSTAPFPMEVRFDDTREGQVPAGVCRPSVDDVIDEVGSFDVVVVIDHGMAVLDHRPPGEDEWSSIVDPAVRGPLSLRYDAWADQAAAIGAPVVLVSAAVPVAGSSAADAQAADVERRIDAYNLVVRTLAQLRADVILADAAPAVVADPERYDRYDGVHFTPESGGVALVVDHLGAAIDLAMGWR